MKSSGAVVKDTSRVRSRLAVSWQCESDAVAEQENASTPAAPRSQWFPARVPLAESRIVTARIGLNAPRLVGSAVCGRALPVESPLSRLCIHAAQMKSFPSKRANLVNSAARVPLAGVDRPCHGLAGAKPSKLISEVPWVMEWLTAKTGVAKATL